MLLLTYRLITVRLSCHRFCCVRCFNPQALQDFLFKTILILMPKLLWKTLRDIFAQFSCMMMEIRLTSSSRHLLFALINIYYSEKRVEVIYKNKMGCFLLFKKNLDAKHRFFYLA